MKALPLTLTLALLLAAPAATAKPPPQRRSIDRGPKKAAPDVPVKINSDALDVLEGGKTVVWRGRVKVVREDMRVTCDTLTEKRGKTLTCRGNAHMVQTPDPKRNRPEREAWGEVAVYDYETAVLTVTGSPRGREGENRFRCDKVSFDARTDRLRGEGHVVMDVVTPADRDPLKPAADGGTKEPAQ